MKIYNVIKLTSFFNPDLSSIFTVLLISETVAIPVDKITS